MELLGISRPRLNQLVQKNIIIPVKKTGAITLFLKDDILAKKDELIELRAKYRPWEEMKD